MIIDGENIILDLNTDDVELAEKITESQKKLAAKEYQYRYRKAANDSQQKNPIILIIKIIPALIFLLIAALELRYNVAPGSSFIYSCIAIAYFAIAIVYSDTLNSKKKFKSLCEDNYLIEETNEMLKHKTQNFEHYLIERDKKLQKIFNINNSGSLMLKEPFNRLLTVDDNNEVVMALPISYNTDTRTLQYNLFNEVETCEFSEEDIITGTSSTTQGYIYIDLINCKLGLFI